MDVVLKLAGKGDTRLIVQPNPSDNDGKHFILIETADDVNNPYMSLYLNGMELEILSQHDIEEDNIDEVIEELTIRLVDALQRNEDLSDEALVKSGEESDEKPYDSGKIRVESRNFSLRNIYDMINDGDLDLAPDFQRNLVWDNFRKSRLIESILLRIPLPMFYFSSDENGRLSVVDGLQRLTAIKQFMDNKLVLRDLEYLKGCEGKVFRDKNPDRQIDDKHYRWFNMTQIVVNVIDSQSPAEVKYDIFRRLNTGGRPLNSQEIRNCLADQRLRDALKRMVALDSFKTATGMSISDRRMNAQEIALRFLYFRKLKEMDAIGRYSGNMDRDLDAFVDYTKREKDYDFEKYELQFDNAMKNAKFLFGKHAFRKISKKSLDKGFTSVINKALFLTWSVVLSEYSHDDVIKKTSLNSFVETLANRIDGDETYFNFISYGTNGWKNLMYAFDVAIEITRSKL